MSAMLGKLLRGEITQAEYVAAFRRDIANAESSRQDSVAQLSEAGLPHGPVEPPRGGSVRATKARIASRVERARFCRDEGLTEMQLVELEDAA